MNPFEFVRLMEKIAAKNDDEFVVRFFANPRRNTWRVYVEESAEGHQLIGGVGATPEKACADALTGLCNRLHAWGYEGV